MTHIEIDRIQISLHGVSSRVATEAARGLDEELRRRLGGLQLSTMQNSAGHASAGPVKSKTVLDAAALRGIIADRVVQEISHRIMNTRGDLK